MEGAVEHINAQTPVGSKISYANRTYDLKVYTHNRFEPVKMGHSGIIEVLKPIGKVYGTTFFPEDKARVMFMNEDKIKAYYTIK